MVLPDGALFVALDGAPERVEIDADGAVRLTGWTASHRVIAPYGQAGFSRLIVDGDRLRFEGARPDAAELRQGGVLLHLSEAGAAMPTSHARAPSAADAETHSAAAAGAEPVSDAQHHGRNSDGGAAYANASPDAGLERTPAQAEPAAAAPSAPAHDGEPVAGPCDAQAAALADAPWDLDLIVAQADCLVEAGERANAVGLYERVLAFEPEHFRAALGLARLREHAGRHEDAARLFEAAAGSALTDGEALAARAAARRARERSDR